jgi:transcriptional regulator GlxA family with amidase domain
MFERGSPRKLRSTKRIIDLSKGTQSRIEYLCTGRKFEESCDPMNSRLETVTDWQSRAKECNYSVKELAAHCNVSRRQLERFFKSTAGISVGIWLKEMRLERGKSLLFEGGRTKQVADACAYSQASSFCRAFKHQFGFKPKKGPRSQELRQASF